MSRIPLNEIADAPEAARPLLEGSVKAFGMLPGLHKALSNSPQALEGYQKLHALFQQSSLTDVEKHVVWQSINTEHGCTYCRPAHSMIGRKMLGVSEALDNAIQDGAPLGDAKLEALRSFTLTMLRARGHVPAAEMDAFFAAGYGPGHVRDVLLGLAQKVMSNYTNHMAETPVDPAFAEYVREPAAAA